MEEHEISSIALCSVQRGSPMEWPVKWNMQVQGGGSANDWEPAPIKARCGLCEMCTFLDNVTEDADQGKGGQTEDRNGF